MRKATLAQVSKLMSKLESGEIDRETVQAIIEGRVQIAETPTTKGSETVYTLTLDRAMSLTDMIAKGKYDWVHYDIAAEHFPLERTDGETGKEDREVVLVHLDEYLTTEQVNAELDRRGLKPASIVELLALGTAHPDLQREFPVVALGSSWRDPGGRGCVPALWHDAYGERHLDLLCVPSDDAWSEYYRFLALRK